MKDSALLMLLLSWMCMAGCSTRYQPMGDTGGYYNEKVDDKTYIVGVHGNGFTSRQTVKEMARLRAAEIGMQLKYEYLSIDGESHDSKISAMNLGSTSNTYGTYDSSTGGFYGTTYTNNNTMYVSKPRIQLKVVYYHEMPTEPMLEIHKLHDLFNEYATRYGITRITTAENGTGK